MATSPDRSAPLVVQKYGGSSVAGAERIRRVAQRIADTIEGGHRVLVVVSAMGDTTDELIDLARQISHEPDPRELDTLLSTGEIVSSTLMAMALRELGYESVSLTGGQAGIRTDGIHSRARILAISPERLLRELERGRVVIVAGFQGVSHEEDVTTLGRGGSDTTAVAIAAALSAQVCEIYTDVDGVFSADPRIEPGAHKLDEISYQEMLELAQQGARVMHPRAVELGEVYGMPILVRSSFNTNPGTLIHGGPFMEIRNKVRGVAHDTNVAKIALLGVPDRPGIAATVFEPLAAAGISVDTIVQNASVDGLTDLSFTVSRTDLGQSLRLVEPVRSLVGARAIVPDATLAKVTIVGAGIQNAPGYAATMFRALAARGINIEMITTSEIRITCLIHEGHVAEAVRALHAAFKLESDDELSAVSDQPSAVSSS
ncbi:MAG: aspartate kinase [Chloroflexi bacterium]|nr:aspartate kinase [Chloroflexota bacterium]